MIDLLICCQPEKLRTFASSSIMHVRSSVRKYDFLISQCGRWTYSICQALESWPQKNAADHRAAHLFLM